MNSNRHEQHQIQQGKQQQQQQQWPPLFWHTSALREAGTEQKGNTMRRTILHAVGQGRRLSEPMLSHVEGGPGSGSGHYNA